MSIVCIARRHEEPGVKFRISYLKNSVWLKDNGDARVMIHCVIQPDKNSAPFSSLRIVVSGNISGLKSKSQLLLDKDHMEEYEDAPIQILDEDNQPLHKNMKFQILDEEEGLVFGNGGEYFVSEVSCDNVNHIDGKFTEFLVSLHSTIEPGKPYGFRIEFISQNFIKEIKNVSSYHVGLYQYPETIRPLQRLSDMYPDKDIMEVGYCDIWVVLPKHKVSSSINPAPIEIADFKSIPRSSGYKEWNIEKDVGERVAYRWRKSKCNITSGHSIYGEFSEPPLSKWWTILAILLAVIGILLYFL